MDMDKKIELTPAETRKLREIAKTVSRFLVGPPAFGGGTMWCFDIAACGPNNPVFRLLTIPLRIDKGPEAMEEAKAAYAVKTERLRAGAGELSEVICFDSSLEFARAIAEEWPDDEFAQEMLKSNPLAEAEA